MKKKKSENVIVSARAANHIANVCNILEDSYKKNVGDIKTINNNDYQMKPKILFTENEQLHLASIIPTSYLNEFKERFDAVENQRYELMGNLKSTQEQETNRIGKGNLQLNYTELKKKELKSLSIDFNSKIAKQNAKISTIKLELNKVTKEYNNWNKLLKLKNNETIRLNNYINEILNNKNKDKDNDKNKEKDKDKNGKIEQNYITSKKNVKTKKNNRNINLQQQNNIHFGYEVLEQ